MQLKEGDVVEFGSIEDLINKDGVLFCSVKIKRTCIKSVILNSMNDATIIRENIVTRNEIIIGKYENYSNTSPRTIR